MIFIRATGRSRYWTWRPERWWRRPNSGIGSIACKFFRHECRRHSLLLCSTSRANLSPYLAGPQCSRSAALRPSNTSRACLGQVGGFPISLLAVHRFGKEVALAEIALVRSSRFPLFAPVSHGEKARLLRQRGMAIIWRFGQRD